MIHLLPVAAALLKGTAKGVLQAQQKESEADPQGEDASKECS